MGGKKYSGKIISLLRHLLESLIQGADNVEQATNIHSRERKKVKEI